MKKIAVFSIISALIFIIGLVLIFNAYDYGSKSARLKINDIVVSTDELYMVTAEETDNYRAVGCVLAALGGAGLLLCVTGFSRITDAPVHRCEPVNSASWTVPVGAPWGSSENMPGGVLTNTPQNPQEQ